MVKGEITLNELLDEFKLKLDLPEKFLGIVLSSDFLKSDLQKDKGKYIFSVDDVVLTINPKDKNETISSLVVINDKVIGGVIYGYTNVQYLN